MPPDSLLKHFPLVDNQDEHDNGINKWDKLKLLVLIVYTVYSLAKPTTLPLITWSLPIESKCYAVQKRSQTENHPLIHRTSGGTRK